MTEYARRDYGEGERRVAGSPQRRSSGGRTRSLEHAVLELQRRAGNAAVAGVLDGDDAAASVRRTIASGGRPLEASVRGRMEQAFGTDFSTVRLHTGSEAAASAAAVSARAYTAGENIAFSPGAYSPGSSAGDQVLAHELAHVVQQRSGPVAGTPVGGGMSVSDPGDHHERSADAAAGGALQRLLHEG